MVKKKKLGYGKELTRWHIAENYKTKKGFLQICSSVWFIFEYEYESEEYESISNH